MLYAALVPLLPHFEQRYGLTKGGVGALAAAYAIGTFAGGLPAVFVAVRDPEFLTALWLMTIPALLFGALNVLVPLALSRHGFGAVALGAVWVSAAAVEASINPFIGRVTDRRGFAFPVRIALVGSFIVSLALAATEWPPLLVPLVFAAGLSFGGFYAPSLTLLSNSAERVGMAQG